MRTRPILENGEFLAGARALRLRENNLGQIGTNPWGAVTQGTPFPGTTTTGGTGVRCYKCGTQPPRQMLPSMAAVVPGGCQEVLASECSIVTATSAASATTTPSVPVCTSADPIVCAVMEAQALYRQVYNQQITAWGSSPQAQALAGDNARYAVENSLQNPTLRSGWYIYGSWLGDAEIKPEEWPELIKNFEQMWAVWAAVPWPTGMVDDLFIRCAKGVKLHGNYSVFDPRLYVNRFSSFWPKTDEEIRRIIANTSLQNIQSIYACMEHRIERKIVNSERQAMKWQVIGMAAGMAFTGNIAASTLFSAASQLQQFNSAAEFSKFMMGYGEFIVACRTAEAEDFTCTYLAPFVLWCMEVLFMGDFYDYVALEVGLPGAEPGLTQEQVVPEIVKELEDAGVDVPKAAYTPGGVAPKPNILVVAGGVGVVGVLALLLGGVFK